MTNNNSIIPITPKTYEDVERFAKAMVASGFFSDLTQLSQAIVKIVAGSVMGFDAFTSIRGIYIIKGNTTFSANLMAVAIKRSNKYTYLIKELTDEICSIEFFELPEKTTIGISTFTIENAKNAGLWQQMTWQKYTKNMLFARALSNGQRWFCPDVFGGTPVYTPEEIDETLILNEEGEIINNNKSLKIIENIGNSEAKEEKEIINNPENKEERQRKDNLFGDILASFDEVMSLEDLKKKYDNAKETLHKENMLVRLPELAIAKDKQKKILK